LRPKNGVEGASGGLREEKENGPKVGEREHTFVYRALYGKQKKKTCSGVKENP